MKLGLAAAIRWIIFFISLAEISEILKKEKLDRKDFIIKQIPELSSEGSEREILMHVKGFKTLEFSDDELNKGKKKQVVKFYLPIGCYATVVVESLLNN